jgi:hypothetical protein
MTIGVGMISSSSGPNPIALGGRRSPPWVRHIYWRAGMSASDPYRTRTIQDFLQRKFIIEPHSTVRKSLM